MRVIMEKEVFPLEAEVLLFLAFFGNGRYQVFFSNSQEST